MVGKKSPYKDAVVCVRLPSRIKQIMERAAYGEGLDLSAWLRSIIIGELKRRGLLPTTILEVEEEEGYLKESRERANINK